MTALIIIIAIVVAEAAAVWWVAAKIYKLASNPNEVSRKYFSVCPPNKIIIPMSGENVRKYVSNCRGFDIHQDTGIMYFIDDEKVSKGGGEIKLLPDGKIERPERFQSLSSQTYTGILDELWGCSLVRFTSNG